jgi:hypothetical protein
VALLTLTSVFKQNQKKVLVFQAIATLVDLVGKALIFMDVISVSNDIAVIDDRIVRMMLSLSTEAVTIPTFVYIGMILLSWILPFTYHSEG